MYIYTYTCKVLIIIALHTTILQSCQAALHQQPAPDCKKEKQNTLTTNLSISPLFGKMLPNKLEHVRANVSIGGSSLDER